jgi:hypothetical protein
MPLSSERTGNGIYETRVEAGVASDRARYSAVFPTFTRIAASRTVRPLASKPLARVSLSDVTTGFRPPCRPRAAAAARPALVRSRILARLGQDASPDMIPHVAPLGWQHIALTGDYTWNLAETAEFETLRPLRTEASMLAA